MYIYKRNIGTLLFFQNVEFKLFEDDSSIFLHLKITPEIFKYLKNILKNIINSIKLGRTRRSTLPSSFNLESSEFIIDYLKISRFLNNVIIPNISSIYDTEILDSIETVFSLSVAFNKNTIYEEFSYYKTLLCDKGHIVNFNSYDLSKLPTISAHLIPISSNQLLQGMQIIESEQARRIAEQQARRIESEQARRIAEQRARRIESEQARRIESEQARRIAEQHARLIAEQHARLIAEQAEFNSWLRSSDQMQTELRKRMYEEYKKGERKHDLKYFELFNIP
jgi:hypothetical protein